MWFAMTTLRLVPLPVHGALEMLVGLALMVAPFVLGLTTAGMIVVVVVGAVVVGLALQSIETDRGPVYVSAHYAADHGLVLGMAAAAIVLSATDNAAALVLGTAAAVQLALNLTTRYSAR